jgi:hypothetical protein
MFGFVPRLKANSSQALKVHARTPTSVPPLQSRHRFLIAFKPDAPARRRSSG